jgi:subtilisin-like proprotein convertase family protein
MQPICFLEHVTATVALNYTERRGLIEINLISPSGLTSPLLTLSLYDSFSTDNELSWTFKSVQILLKVDKAIVLHDKQKQSNH